VLVADGERISSAVVSASLSEAGFGEDVAADGRAAMEAVTAGGYDILITDRALPRLDGLDFVTAVRERPEFQDLYVIFVTARDRKSEVVQGFDAGADDYLTKPFDPRELIARVRSGTRILSLQRELEALNGTLSRLAMTDSLTDLPNRRAVLELLATESARMSRGGPPSCVGVLDIDNFKRRTSCRAATGRATRCWSRSRGRCAPRPARRTWSGAWAAMSSSSCSTGARWTRRSRSATACAQRSRA
jgi:PleD family two-component response regulator